MKIAVAGKGGSGKTTIAGTLARLMAQSGRHVVALDADTNPMLGVSVGLGAEETDILLSAREGLDSGETEHQPTLEGLVAEFGTEAPDGVQVVVVNRIDNIDPG
ncbi:MAG: AAA family ATPase [Acidimicrobiia bacterium]|nr:AAA family ATPase [Acidimicrobiia bacterium]